MRPALPLLVVVGGALCLAYACGDSQRRFVDVEQGGSSGTGDLGGSAGTGGSSGAGRGGGGLGGTTSGTGGGAGEAGEPGSGGDGTTGGSSGRGGGGEGGEGGEVVEPPPTVSPPGQNITSASGRMTSTTYTLHVEVGHGYGQQRAASATYQLEANTAIKP